MEEKISQMRLALLRMLILRREARIAEHDANDLWNSLQEDSQFAATFPTREDFKRHVFSLRTDTEEEK